MTDTNTVKEIQKYESGLDMEKHNKLAAKFNPFMEQVNGLLEDSKAVQVAGENDSKGMEEARNLRLALKAIRVDVEKTRKTLKEASLLEGKAIDGMANIIKFIIQPTEKELQEKEDIVRLAEQRKIDEITESRKAELQEIGVDCKYYDLGTMPDKDYNDLIEASKFSLRKRKEEEAAETKRIEDERIAKEKIEAERKRMADEAMENAKAEAAEANKAAEKAKAEADAIKKKAETERLADQKKIDDMKKAESERVKAEEDKRIAALEAEKKANEDKAKAPDTEKINSLIDNICELDVPSVTGQGALKAILGARKGLNQVVLTLRKCVEEMAK